MFFLCSKQKDAETKNVFLAGNNSILNILAFKINSFSIYYGYRFTFSTSKAWKILSRMTLSSNLKLLLMRLMNSTFSMSSRWLQFILCCSMSLRISLRLKWVLGLICFANFTSAFFSRELSCLIVKDFCETVTMNLSFSFFYGIL